MRLPILAAALLFASPALAATVFITSPSQGETFQPGSIEIQVAVSQDFTVGKDGFVQLFVDSAPSIELKGTSGSVILTPGNHTIQARLVGPNHQSLRVPVNSEGVTFNVAAADPRSP